MLSALLNKTFPSFLLLIINVTSFSIVIIIIIIIIISIIKICFISVHNSTGYSLQLHSLCILPNRETGHGDTNGKLGSAAEKRYEMLADFVLIGASVAQW